MCAPEAHVWGNAEMIRGEMISLEDYNLVSRLIHLMD